MVILGKHVLLVCAFFLNATMMDGNEYALIPGPIGQDELVQYGVSSDVAAQISGLNTEGLKALALARFDGVSNDALRVFASNLSLLHPEGISILKPNAFISYRQEIAPPLSGRVWELHFEVRGNKASGQFDVFKNKNLQSILKSVSGLRVSLEFGRGFLSAPELASRWSQGFEIEPTLAANSYVIFHASNGDMLLSDKLGRCGWLVLETSEHVPCEGEYLPWFVRNFISILSQSGSVDFWSVRRFQKNARNR